DERQGTRIPVPDFGNLVPGERRIRRKIAETSKRKVRPYADLSPKGMRRSSPVLRIETGGGTMQPMPQDRSRCAPAATRAMLRMRRRAIARTIVRDSCKR